jgi:hypothetical protein
LVWILFLVAGNFFSGVLLLEAARLVMVLSEEADASVTCLLLMTFGAMRCFSEFE